MANHKTTTHPPVHKELRPVVAWLRDRDGCSFDVHSGYIVVLRSDGKPARADNGQAVRISSKGRANDIRAIHASIRQLQSAGLLQGYAAGRTERKRSQHHQPAERSQHHQPATPVAAAAKPTAVAPAPAPEPKEVPVPQQPAKPTPAVAPVRPVRAHTAHQARLDSVRGRIFRALADLGGNTSEVRRLFVEHAIEVAEQHGLPLPIPGKLGGNSTAYESLRSSLTKYLGGGGQSQRNLDIWELAVQALERPMPKPQVAETPLAVAAAQVGVPVRIPGGRSGSRGVGVQVVQGQDEDGYIRHEVLGGTGIVDHVREAVAEVERLAGTGARGSAPLYVSQRSEAAPAPVPEPLAAQDPATVDILRTQYLQDLAVKAAEGDSDARDRLERYLGLG